MRLEHISPAQWEQITESLMWLWLIVAAVILFNGSLLFGRAVVPSLVNFTHSVPERAGRLVLLFAITGALALIGVIFFAIQFSDSVQVIYDVYERKWY